MVSSSHPHTLALPRGKPRNRRALLNLRPVPPTSQQIDKSESRKADKLASIPPPIAAKRPSPCNQPPALRSHPHHQHSAMTALCNHCIMQSPPRSSPPRRILPHHHQPVPAAPSYRGQDPPPCIHRRAHPPPAPVARLNPPPTGLRPSISTPPTPATARARLHSFLLPGGKPPHHPPRQLSNFPTSRKVEKPESRQVGELAHTTTHQGQAPAYRGEFITAHLLLTPPVDRHPHHRPVPAASFSPIPAGRPNAAKTPPPTYTPSHAHTALPRGRPNAAKTSQHPTH